MNKYEWKIKACESFSGRFGVINDTNNISQSKSIINGSFYWKHPAVINTGASKGRHEGTK